MPAVIPAASPAGPRPRTPADHVKILHGRARRAGVEVAQPGGGLWRGEIVPLDDLEFYVTRLDPDLDTYMSQGRFHGRRRVVHLVSIGSVWVDLDFYRTKQYQRYSAERMVWHVLYRCDASDVPRPSFIISTGRGLCVVWLHDELPRAALPRWQLVERALIRCFAGMGADASASDPARVFRLTGTSNSKARARGPVRAVYPAGGDVRVLDFEELAEALLPYTRDQVAAFRQKAGRRRSHRTRRLSSDVGAGLLWARRLDDLQRLRFWRFFGELPAGHRDMWLLLASTALGWMIDPSTLRREVLELAREALGHAWTEREILGTMGATIRRAEAAARGEKIAWEGERIDPRYRFRTETIIERLGIMPEDEAGANLQTLVSPQRLAVLQASKGRGSGAKRREVNAERDAAIVGAVLGGEPIRAVAERAGLEPSTISRIVRRDAPQFHAKRGRPGNVA